MPLYLKVTPSDLDIEPDKIKEILEAGLMSQGINANVEVPSDLMQCAMEVWVNDTALNFDIEIPKAGVTKIARETILDNCIWQEVNDAIDSAVNCYCWEGGSEECQD